MASNDNRIEQLLAKDEIRDVIYRWMNAVDRKNWAVIPTLFHEDAYDDHGMYKGGVPGLMEWLPQRHAHILRSVHHVGNILIEFDGDNAYVETYILAYQEYVVPPTDKSPHIFAALGEKPPTDGVVKVLFPARYVDRFERRSGRWRIAHRITVFEARHILGTGETQFDPSWTIGRRDHSDAFYQIRTARKP